MAAAGDPKGFKQDMVVSIRYRNDLPPPPMPPKFLEIDNGGLAQYLTTSFASAMARREEPNIEVDAEGGMPIDMIGIPGYFLGDESAIMAPEIQPVLDPADHALMLTPDQLKNQGSKSSNVSFLRRTQYMTSQNARANDPLMRADARTSKSINSKSSLSNAPFARDDRQNIIRHIQKGFDIAYPESVPHNPPEAKATPSTEAERDAWRNPVHPDNARLKPVEYFPVLPDFDAYTDVGGYISVKFDKPPLPATHGHRDDRADVAILFKDKNEALMPAWEARKAAYEQNPKLYEDPGDPPTLWSYCVPETKDSAARLKKILNDADPDKDDPVLWEGLNEHDSENRIGYRRTKTYPVNKQEIVNSSRFMALSLFNPTAAPDNSRLKKHGKAAYYYPVEQRLRMRADRGKLGRATQSQNMDENMGEAKFDVIELGTTEPQPVVSQLRLWAKKERDGQAFGAEYERLTAIVEAENARLRAEAGDADGEEDEDVEMGEGEGDKERRETNGKARPGIGSEDDADADADADAEADPNAMEDD